jgi:sulfide:quinone oxidoreductase
MAKVLIVGGGFGGVVAAERLAEQLGDEHQITLVSRSRQFVFYPALVRLAFGKSQVADVSFDLRQSLLNRRVNFIEAEVAHVDPFERNVTIAHGEVEGKLPYDYLVFALGRRLATERITGFYEHAHHLLNVDKAISFGKEELFLVNVPAAACRFRFMKAPSRSHAGSRRKVNVIASE